MDVLRKTSDVARLRFVLESESNMSKSSTEINPEYDFSKGVRGKYASRYRAGANLVVLDPELTVMFPDSNSVNQALRSLVAVANRASARSRVKNKKPLRISKVRRRA